MSNHYTPGSDQDLGELITTLKNSTNTRLRDMLTKMLNDADGNLLEMAEEAAYSHEKDVFYWLRNKLKDKKPEVAADFMTHIMKLLRPYTVTQAEEAAQKAEELDDELSLVGQDDMEDLVLVKNVGTETSSKFREQISHLETRLDHLALKSPDIFAKNALAPMKISQAFDDALIDKFELPERKALFTLFKDDVAYKLDGLYNELNKLMIDAGILPQIKITRGARRAPSPPPPPPPMDMPPEEGEMHGEEPYYGDYSGYAGGYAATPAPGAYGTGQTGGMSQGGPMPQPGMPQGGPVPPAGMPQGGPMPPPGMPQGGPMPPPGMPQGGATPAGGMPQGGSPVPGNGGAAPGGPGGAGQGGSPVPGNGGSAPGAPGGGAPQGSGGAPANYPFGQTAAPGGNYGDASASAGPAGDAGAGHRGSQPPPDAHGVYQHYTAGLPASQVSNTLGSFLGAPVTGGGARAAAEGQEVPAYPVSTAQHFGHDEILTALTSIQAQPQFTESGELRFDAEVVKNAVMTAIAKKSGGIVTKRMNQIAEKTIDFIELVFDAIIEDPNISDTIKALLLRLQIPVIKASMIDQEFFIYDDHPARVLLDRIAEVGMGVTEHGDEIYIRLDRIVNQLISEYELDTNTFQAALDKVNDFVEELGEAARRKEEEAQQQALREHARNSVLKSLRNITTGKSLPEAVHPLVLKRWPTLLFNHYLEHGKENDGWIELVEVLRDIVISVQPFDTAEDYAYLLAEKDHLVSRVNDHLSRTYKSKKDIQDVISGLITTYDEMIADSNFQVEEIQEAEKTAAESPREKEPVKPEPAHVPKTKLPSNVMPGMWFQLFMGDDKPARRCKLSVIIVEDEKLIFVTHTGEVVSEKSYEEFTRELDRGKSKVIMGHSVFDYALNSVITKLDPTLH